MKKNRPCLLLQAGAIGEYYNRTKLIAIPFTSKTNPTLDLQKSFTLEIQINQKKSTLLIYNFVTRTEEEIKIWYTKDNREVYITKEKKKEVLKKMEEYNMEVLSYENEALGRKTMYQQLKESNMRLETSHERLKESEKEAKKSIASLEASNAKLEESNKRLEEKVDNLVNIIEKLVQVN